MVSRLLIALVLLCASPAWSSPLPDILTVTGGYFHATGLSMYGDGFTPGPYGISAPAPAPGPPPPPSNALVPLNHNLVPLASAFFNGLTEVVLISDKDAPPSPPSTVETAVVTQPFMLRERGAEHLASSAHLKLLDPSHAIFDYILLRGSGVFTTTFTQTTLCGQPNRVTGHVSCSPGYVRSERYDFYPEVVSEVPEPSSIGLVMCGIAVLAFVRLRQRTPA